MTAVELRRGYLLHQRPLSDSRKIIDILTPGWGRVTGVVRLGKKKPSLMLFQPYLFSWLGRVEFKTFTAFEIAEMPVALSGNALYCAFYLNELLQRLLPVQEEVDDLFAKYEALLKILTDAQNIELPLRYFELQLLQRLGYEYSFEHEGFSEIPITQEGHYSFNAHQGFTRVAAPHKAGFLGQDLLAYARGEENPAVQKMLKRMCRLAISARLGREPLKSRDFFVKPGTPS